MSPEQQVQALIGKRVRVVHAPSIEFQDKVGILHGPESPHSIVVSPDVVAVIVVPRGNGTIGTNITKDELHTWALELVDEAAERIPEFGLPWGSEVIVKVSLRHRDLIGKRGTLQRPPVRSQLAAQLRIGSEVWPIDRTQDWELEAAPAPGMPCGKETFLWGEELHVKRCQHHPELEGLTGMLAAPPEGSDLAGLFWVGADRYEVSRGSRWQFERTCADLLPNAPALDAELTAAELAAGVDTSAPRRRSREVYDHMAFTLDLDAAVKEIRDLLVEKNQAYGNSALDPVRIFSKAAPMEQLFVRIDDKLSRLKRGHAAGEDVVKDLQGYLLLVRVAQMRAARELKERHPHE